MVQEFVHLWENSKEGEKLDSKEFKVGEAKLCVVVYPKGSLKFPGPVRIGIWNKGDKDVVLEGVQITVENITGFRVGLKTLKVKDVLTWGLALGPKKVKILMDGKLEVKIEVEVKGGWTILGDPPTTEPATQGQMVVLECPVCFEKMRRANGKIVQCQRGHKICEPCFQKPSIVSCPTCKMGFIGRDFGMEAILE